MVATEGAKAPVLGEYGLHWRGRSRGIVGFFVSRSTEHTSLFHGELIREDDIPSKEKSVPRRLRPLLKDNSLDNEVSRTSDL